MYIRSGALLPTKGAKVGTKKEEKGKEEERKKRGDSLTVIDPENREEP